MELDISLRILQENDVTEEYVNWFHQKEVILFSDNQYRNFSLEGQKEYVKSKLSDEACNLYGIFHKSRHVGNIVLENINTIHRRAEISYVIGNTDYWGKGAASKAISEIIQLARNKFHLNKLNAGVADKNEGSKKVLIKNGFKIEGKKKKHLFYNNQWMDQLDFELILNEKI